MHSVYINPPLVYKMKSITLSSNILQYRKCQVRNGRFGKPLNFRLCDTKGIEKDDGIDPHEFCFILDGNMPNGYLVCYKDKTYYKVYDK